MFPFTINGRKKVKIKPQYFADYLKRLKDSLVESKGIREVDIYGNTPKINIEIFRYGGKFIYSIMPSSLGFFNTCELNLYEEEGESYLSYKISYLPLLSLTFIFLPFFIISLLSGSDIAVFYTVLYLYSWFLVPIYVISLIEYFFFIVMI